MQGKVEFALWKDGKKHPTRRVELHTPIVIVKQPARCWAFFLSTTDDMQSADIIRKMGPEFCIMPTSDDAVVTIELKEGESHRLSTNVTKRFLSRQSQMNWPLPHRG